MKKQIIPPSECPSCDSTLVLVKDQLFCRNPSCSARSAKRLEHYAKTMKIKGLGPKTIEKLGLEDIWQLYAHTKEFFVSKLGTALGGKLYTEIQDSKEPQLEYFIAAFSIPLVGRTAGRNLSQVVSSMDEITWEKCKKAGLGDKASTNLMAWLEDEWLEIGPLLPIKFVSVEKSAKVEHTDIIVVITGKLNDFKNRSDAEAFLIQNYGVTCKSSVSKTTTYVVSEEGRESSTIKKAKQLNIPIVTINQLIKENFGELKNG